MVIYGRLYNLLFTNFVRINGMFSSLDEAWRKDIKNKIESSKQITQVLRKLDNVSFTHFSYKSSRLNALYKEA